MISDKLVFDWQVINQLVLFKLTESSLVGSQLSDWKLAGLKLTCQKLTDFRTKSIEN